MFILDPGCCFFYPSRIPDPTTATKVERGKFLFDHPLFVATNIIKLWIIVFEQVKKIF
jgi:hypothetical protein